MGPGQHEGSGREHHRCDRDCLLVLHWGVHRQGQPSGVSGLECLAVDSLFSFNPVK